MSSTHRVKRMDVELRALWLLDRCAVYMPSGDMVCASPSELIARFNVVPHVMTEDKVVAKLKELTQHGLIFWEPMADGPRFDANCELDAHNGFQHHFGLTERGAEEWERWAGPCWERFYTDEYSDLEVSSDSAMKVTICCHSLDRLRAIENYFAKLIGRPMSLLSPVQILTPWQATYWRELEEGVKAEYFTESDSPIYDCQSTEGVPRGFQVWCKNGFSANTCENVFKFE